MLQVSVTDIASHSPDPENIPFSSQLQCFLTDIEGTLTSSLEKVHWECHAEIASLLGLSKIAQIIRSGDYAEVIEAAPHFIGGPDDKIYEEFLSLAGSNDYTVTDLLQKKKELYAALYPKTRIEPRPGVVSALEFIKSKNIQLFAGSLTRRELASKIIKDSGLEKFFPQENMICREDVEKVGGQLKPDPAVYNLALEKAGIKPENAIGCEDSLNGVKALQNAGVTAIFLPNIHLPVVYHQSPTPYIFTSWEFLIPILKKLTG